MILSERLYSLKARASTIFFRLLNSSHNLGQDEVTKKGTLFPRLTFFEDGETACYSCGLCIDICPTQCLALEADPHRQGRIECKPTAFHLDILNCTSCGYCQDLCPVDAIRTVEWEDIQVVGAKGFNLLDDPMKPLLKTSMGKASRPSLESLNLLEEEISGEVQ